MGFIEEYKHLEKFPLTNYETNEPSRLIFKSYKKLSSFTFKGNT